MSFTNSGIPGPGFSYPVGVGVFTDVVASNTVFTAFVRGDGGFLSNVNSSIPGTLPNLVVSNSLTVTNVFATIYQGDGGLLSNITAAVYGNTLSNIQASNVVGLNVVYGNTLSNLNASNLAFGLVGSSLILGNTLSNLNASNLEFGLVGSSLILGNTLSNIQASNVVGLNVVYGNTLSNLNASNLAFGLVKSSLLLGNTISNIQSSNVIGIVDPTRIYGNTISNINSSNVTQPFTNLVVSNTLTTTNVVAAGFTSNASNTVFNYTTLSVPYINCTSMNVTTTATYSTLNATNMLATGSIGFATIAGTGGSNTQITSRNTGVTVNKPCGTITLFSSAINSQASNTFTLTNSYIGSTDFVLVNHVQTQTPGAYTIATNPNPGSVDITMRNVSGGTLTAGAPVLQFVVIKSTNA